MERPKVVVLERRHYEHEEEYRDDIEAYIGIGYKVAWRKGSSDPNRDYVVLENRED